MANLEQHLFISYAHIDDQPLTEGQQGWITRFHVTLGALLSMRLGREAKIWRDEKLQGNDVFDAEITSQFTQSAVLISILTSRYLNSDWCTRESREFCENAQHNGGLLVDNRSRVFKVIKTPIDSQEPLPAAMRDVLGYDFFTLKDGAPLELDPAYGQEYAQLYNQKVAKLAWDLAQLLNSLGLHTRSGDDDSEQADRDAGPASKPSVYLAECSYDRKPARETVEAELKRLGYRVFPDRQLPGDEAEYVAAVDSLLARCALSIHFIGESYGAVPDGPSTKSVSVIQNELAAAQCESTGLSRLIWLPAGTRSEQMPQQVFIDSLHQDAAVQFGADLITGELEELKASIHDTLEKLETPQPKLAVDQDAVADHGKLIYLICDEKDRKATVPVRKYFREQGFEVAIPAFEGDATAVREAHRQMMMNCDSVILFYGAGDEAWKRTKDNELKKMVGYRGGKRTAARFTYLAEPKTADKDDLIDMGESDLINGLGEVAEVQMAALVIAMRTGGVAA